MKKKRSGGFFVYMLKCSDKTYYTGYTPDVTGRLDAHNRAKGAKYTRGRLPVELVWQKKYRTKGRAMSVEAAVKKLSREQKQELVNGGVLSRLIRERKK